MRRNLPRGDSAGGQASAPADIPALRAFASERAFRGEKGDCRAEREAGGGTARRDYRLGADCRAGCVSRRLTSAMFRWTRRARCAKIKESEPVWRLCFRRAWGEVQLRRRLRQGRGCGGRARGEHPAGGLGGMRRQGRRTPRQRDLRAVLTYRRYPTRSAEARAVLEKI